MVKIKNVFGDEYRGKQKHMVYQKRYGKQIRRIKEDKKRNDAPAQREQQRRFRVGVAFYKSLTAEEKQALREWLNERGITLTPQQYIIKTALDRGRATKETFTVEVSGRSIVESWHAPDWTYRQKIVITNNSSYDLIDYQVRLDLDSTKVGDHFDWSRQGADLRFFDEAGNKLSYYIESWDEVRRQATVWVKVGSIPGNGTADIFMYYGNENAESESDANSVFDFYDEIRDGANWNFWGDPPGVVDTKIGNPAPSIRGNGDGYYYSGATTKNKFSFYGTALRIDAMHKSDLRRGSFGFDVNQTYPTNAVWQGLVYITLRESERNKRSFTVRAADGTVEQYVENWGGYGEWHTYEICIRRDGIVSFYVDGVHKWTSTKPARYVDYAYISVSGHDPEFWYDNVILRKYVYPEPSVTLGAEEYDIEKRPVLIEVENIIVEHSGIGSIYILDENEEEIARFTNLSNLEQGDIKTIWKWENDTGKTARYVIITSLAGTVNKVRL